MDALWHPLQVASLPTGSPQLLAKASVSSTSYSISLTDLGHVWEESLDRRQIIRRALNEETSIDPSEDASQLRILLGKIKGAIEGEKGTRRHLAKQQNTNALKLRLIAPLPAPLGLLEWTLNLQLQSTNSLRGHIVYPLLHVAYVQRTQIAELVGYLTAKDHVISKLLDKLESSGTEISSVFPGVAGIRSLKHATTREQAALQVQGLGAFNAQQWQHRHDVAHTADIPFDKIVTEVFAGSTSLDVQEDSSDSSQEDWWSSLPLSFEATNLERDSENLEADIANNVDAEEQVLEALEDSFERQETPPHLKRRKLLRSSPARSRPPPATSIDPKDSDETTDDDDLDKPSSAPPRSSQLSRGRASAQAQFSSPEPTPRPRKLGILGGKAAKPHGEPHIENRARTPETTAASSNTEDEDDLDSVAASDTLDPPISSIAEHDPATLIPKRKLGTIGGGRKVGSAGQSVSSTPAPEPTPEPVAAVARPARGKLGKIGGRKTVESGAQEPTPPLGRGAAKGRDSATGAIAAPALDLPSESEEERANRKREELRRELAAKSQAPAKKKRRF